MIRRKSAENKKDSTLSLSIESSFLIRWRSFADFRLSCRWTNPICFSQFPLVREFG
jgi:hypothetical protein